MKLWSCNYINLLWITIVVLHEKQTVNGDDCGCRNATLNEREYLLCPCKKTREEAGAYCQKSLPGGELASIHDASTQDYLANQLKTYQFGDTWVGATNVRQGWHWVSGKGHLLRQGCFNLENAQHDIKNEVAVNNLTADGCISSCRLFGYHYAAVKEGSRCFCGHTVTQPEFSNNCKLPCSGNSTQMCGGTTDYNLFNLNGSYTGEFGRSSVGPLQSPDTAECLQLNCEYEPEGEVWSWVPSACKKKNTRLCMRAISDEYDCDGITKFSLGDTCVIVEELEYTNWYEARWQCLQSGGDLLDISSKSFEESIKSNLECWQSPLWIGATRTSWLWHSEVRSRYSAWAVQNPSGKPDGCMAMSITLSTEYEWTDLECNQFLSFICEKTEEPTTEPPTTTTTTTRKPPTTPTKKGDKTTRGSNGGSTVRGGGGTTNPTAGGSTEPPPLTSGSSGTFDKWKWVYVAVGILGGLCVMLGVGVYVIERTKLGHDRCAGLRRCNCLKPSSHKYDEDAPKPAPNGSVIYDEDPPKTAAPNGSVKSGGDLEKPQENGHAGGNNVVLNMHKTNHDVISNGYYHTNL